MGAPDSSTAARSPIQVPLKFSWQGTGASLQQIVTLGFGCFPIGGLPMRQRTISDEFWRDSQIWGLSQEDTATLLYLLTSPSSNIIGCYRLVWRIAAAEMGWTADQMLVVVMRLQEKGLIEYTESGWVWVKIWWLHNSPAVALNPRSKLITHARKQFADIPRDWLAAFGMSLEAMGINTQEIGYPCPIKGAHEAAPHASPDAPSDAPSGEASQAPSGNTQTHQQQAFDAPSHAAPAAPQDGSGGNRYLVSGNTTTTNSSSEESKPVVVSDLFFPPTTPQTERDSIQAALVGTGIGEEFWQPLVDELFGARLHREIRNPVGYIRGMVERAMNGRFVPEYGVRVAKAREVAAAQERHDQAQNKVLRDSQPPIDEVLNRLPSGQRFFMQKVTGGHGK
jgi:hypothetical protein